MHWLDGLRDVQSRARVQARIERLALGNPGDVAPIGEGVSELRIPHGPGYRVYFKQFGDVLVVLESMKMEIPLLLAVPAVMAAALLAGVEQAALAMLVVVALVLALFFAGYEASRPGLRQIMPTLVLAALAAAGRILFGPIPDFKPVSAIAIIAGATLGRRNGFMVGALAALTSNFFFGQGMWTPWQMYAWGLVGYVGGALAYAGAFDRADGTVRMPALLTYGFASGLLYGVVINAYDIIGFVQPLTWAGAMARLATAVPFDITHGLATCVFLAALYKPWCRRINRVVVKYGL